MSNVATKKVFIQIESEAEQQEHMRNQRKTLKVLQGVATDKENLTGRPPLDKLSRLKAASDATLASTEYGGGKRKKYADTRNCETQTSPRKEEQPCSSKSITAEDLTSDAKPSESYYERLAEKRGQALEETLAENQRLHERIEGLEEELDTSRKLLDEAQHLVGVLTEMLNEMEAEKELDDKDAAKSCTEPGDDAKAQEEPEAAGAEEETPSTSAAGQ